MKPTVVPNLQALPAGLLGRTGAFRGDDIYRSLADDLYDSWRLANKFPEHSFWDRKQILLAFKMSGKEYAYRVQELCRRRLARSLVKRALFSLMYSRCGVSFVAEWRSTCIALAHGNSVAPNEVQGGHQ